MAARLPRRSFAAPFVITLAAAPACYVQSTPTPQGPTQTTQTQPPPPAGTSSTTPDPQKVTVVSNPPRPQATTPNARWTIYADNTGACFSSPKVECPPKTMCNPPPPKPYTCPTEVDLKAFGPATIVSSADGMACSIEYAPMKCPAGAMCNPPPPVSVTCPRP